MKYPLMDILTGFGASPFFDRILTTEPPPNGLEASFQDVRIPECSTHLWEENPYDLLRKPSFWWYQKDAENWEKVRKAKEEIKCKYCMISGYCTKPSCPQYRYYLRSSIFNQRYSPYDDPYTSLLRRSRERRVTFALTPALNGSQPGQPGGRLCFDQNMIQTQMYASEQNTLQESSSQSSSQESSQESSQDSSSETSSSEKSPAKVQRKTQQTMQRRRKEMTQGTLTPLPSSSDSEETDSQPEEQSSSDIRSLLDKESELDEINEESTLRTNGDNEQSCVQATEVRTDQPTARESSSTSIADIRNTLSDHSYYLNQSKYLDNLGIQTPSESEEEIDVVNDVKPGKGKNLKACLEFMNPQRFHRTQSSRRQRKQQQQQKEQQEERQIQQPETVTVEAPVVRRPRGRPPSKTPKKVTVLQEPQQQPAPTPKRGCRGGRKKSRFGISDGGYNSEEELDEETRRKVHNDMERQRRVDQKTALIELRVLVPSTANNEKAAKVTILECAQKYCDILTAEDFKHQNEIVKLSQTQKVLLERLKLLRRKHAKTY